MSNLTTHLSVRLIWNDRGWDGHVCDKPNQNAYCVVNQYIREALADQKNIKREVEAAAMPLKELNEWQPPCCRTSVAFSPIGFEIIHNDPLEFRRLPSTKETILPYSVCPSPYRWMREENFRQLCEDEHLNIRGPDDPKKENGWVYEPDRQIELLTNFWSRLEKNTSLVFFYCDQGNPLDENLNRILLGVGRISNIGPQHFFGKKPPKYPGDYPIWSRCITHDFENQGFVLPYHEYLRKGYDTSNIICRIPEGATIDFSYVGEHVSDDTAVGALERLLQSVQAVKDENKVSGDWSRHIIWINDVLSEVWQNRGPFPGAGSVLQFLGVEVGTAFQRQVLMPLLKRGENAWEYLLAILEGRKQCEEKEYTIPMKQAAGRWAAYSPSRRKLLSMLVRFELTPKQVKRIADADERIKAGINATDEELVENPYLISEMDEGGPDRDVITLEVIDRGMRPEGDTARFLSGNEIIPQDDPHRVRACAVAILKDAAANGDTLLPFNEVLEQIKKRFPERRACSPDRELVIGQQSFYQEILDFRTDINPPTMALRIISELEQEVANRLKRRIKLKNKPPRSDWSWEELLKQEFGEGKGSNLPPEVEERARKEKAKALITLYECRFSVLTGRAGTGKTSVLKVFLKGLEELESRRPILLLAPTGKARVRLMERTKRDDGSVRDAYTIHQLLMRNRWLNPENFVLRYKGGSEIGAPTVIIDEASMIPIDLLGVLFRALDLNQVSRLILVGDPNQLPPIGPGRPFVDIVSWLKADNKEVKKLYPESFQLPAEERNACIAQLTERARHEDHNSLALQLADGYLSDDPTPGDDDLLSRVARQDVDGDLEVHFWRDHLELETLLMARMKHLLNLTDGNGAYKLFNESIGISNVSGQEHEPLKAEHWQILSPVRKQEFGTTEINRKIQAQYRGGLLNKSRREWKSSKKPFGEQELVWTDKVIQIYNCRRKAWPQGGGLDYVANGEIGLVTSTSDKFNSLDVKYSTQPEVSYRYYRKDVDSNLELAYALTVHKAQGSDFDYVFLILPRNASTLSKELLYTGLTRFRQKMVLLIERDTDVLERLRSPQESATLLRNSNLFVMAIRPEDEDKYYANHLIHRTAKDVLVRSKSEVIVADTLTRLEISYEYEKKLLNKDSNPKDYRLPDFTVSYEGDIFYWEHLGMLSVPSYRQSWERKRAWYRENGYEDQLITSEDGPDGSINVTKIEEIARKKILLE
ncbi:AAA family ATPase [Methanosarcina mazei]|uniref:AAA family ATPase n=1 Tax=Methanosarcina mazei TaxID=2209 RepID=UPI000A3E9064|nr:AAA family ATPase [Methanosarcina mazei]